MRIRIRDPDSDKHPGSNALTEIWKHKRIHCIFTVVKIKSISTGAQLTPRIDTVPT
jgi:hypothetical protein